MTIWLLHLSSKDAETYIRRKEKERYMKTRIITALVLIPILVVLLVFANSAVIAAAIAIVSVMGLAEFYKAVGVNKSKLLCGLGCVAGAATPLVPMLFRYFFAPETVKDVTGLIICLFLLAMFAVMLVCHKKISVADVGLVIFSLVYIPYFLTNILYIHEMEQGKFLIWLVFIGAFLTDSCAYFVGIFLGKNKLCPEISPKKTIEGAVGGVLGCMIFYVLYGLLMKHAFEVDVNFFRLGILGLIAAVISEMGDLVASIIKRHYGIKDYGTLFPGHGGILDRCDSVILVSPVIYIYLSIVGIF